MEIIGNVSATIKPTTVASGSVPSEFNQYKCGFKALEYMAMKIPVVSSDVAENMEIIEDSVNGFFATSAEEWKLYIELLLEDVVRSEGMGIKGHKLVEMRYSTKRAAACYLA